MGYSTILGLFEKILFTESGEDKPQRYHEVLRGAGLEGADVVIVDDYVIRGIAWGNEVGAMTIWYRNGKFADVLPTEKTGRPTFTIHSLSELLPILL